MADRHPTPVTDTGDPNVRASLTDAASRDCKQCGRAIGPSDTLHLALYYGERWEGYCEPCAAEVWTDLDRRRKDQGGYVLNDPDKPGYDPLDRLGRERFDCLVCGRPFVGERKAAAACSPECHERYPAAATREHRRRKRESEIPESFTCSSCQKEIEGTVVFGDKVRCEPCYVDIRTMEARELHESYKDGRFGAMFPDPDAAGWSPYRRGYEVRGCGNCGRMIRSWSGFCCDRCEYEAGKAARRVEPKPKKCEWCGAEFVPKRSDAKTCSDAHRQALRRSKQKPKRVTAKRVARARAQRTDTSNRSTPGGVTDG
jgi:hypothetical protein